MHGYGIMSAKGRVKWPYRHLPSLLEQMPMRPFDERSEPVKPKVLRVSARTYRKPKQKPEQMPKQMPKADAKANAKADAQSKCPSNAQKQNN